MGVGSRDAGGFKYLRQRLLINPNGRSRFGGTIPEIPATPRRDGGQGGDNFGKEGTAYIDARNSQIV
jgi:hypothetical protein